MEWETFIKNIAGKQGLSIEETETLLARFPSEDEKSQEKDLAKKFVITEDTVGKRMQSIHEKFYNLFPELKEIKGAGKSNKLHQYLKQKFHQQNDPSTPHPPQKLITGFESLIEEKLKNFQGREFVFNEFKEFLNQKKKDILLLLVNLGWEKVRSQLNTQETIKRYIILTMCLSGEPLQSDF